MNYHYQSTQQQLNPSDGNHQHQNFMENFLPWMLIINLRDDQIFFSCVYCSENNQNISSQKYHSEPAYFSSWHFLEAIWGHCSNLHLPIQQFLSDFALEVKVTMLPQNFIIVACGETLSWRSMETREPSASQNRLSLAAEGKLIQGMMSGSLPATVNKSNRDHVILMFLVYKLVTQMWC